MESPDIRLCSQFGRLENAKSKFGLYSSETIYPVTIGAGKNEAHVFFTSFPGKGLD